MCGPWGAQDINHARLNLSSEAQGYLASGSPEAQVFGAVPADGCSLADLKVPCSAPDQRFTLMPQHPIVCLPRL